MSYYSSQDTIFFRPLWTDSPLYNLDKFTTQVDTVGMLRPANSAQQVWGVNSSVSENMISSTVMDRMEPGIEHWQTLVVMVVVICLYCYIMYRFRRDMMHCLKNIGNMADTLNMMEDQAADFIYFLRSGVVLAVLGIASIVTVWLGLKLPHIESYYLFLGVVISSVLIVIYRWLVFLVIRWMSDDRDSFVQIIFINRINITFIALIYTPLAITIGVSGQFFNIGLVVLGGLILYHFMTIYKYFRSRLFSKLQLILYLCTVEILPVSFIIVLAVRQSGIN